MPFVLRPPGEDTLADRLAGIGQARRFAGVTAGVFGLAAAAVAGLAAACALDAAAHLPPVPRALLLAGWLAGVGVQFARGVRGPAAMPTHPLAVALLLEDKFPRLNDALASAVEFLTADGRAAERIGAARFRTVAVVRAQNLADRLDLDSVVPSGRAWRAFWAAVAVSAVAGLLVVANPARAAIALARFADPYGGHAYPTRTQLELTEPAAFPARHAKGDPFVLRFTARGEVPEFATVSIRLADGAAADEGVPLRADGETISEKTVELRLDAGRVPRDFDLRITANDADTGWLPVSVAPPPALVPLDGRPSPQFHLNFPAYTDLPPADLPDGTGVIEAVTGTRVSLRAAADRRVAAAVLRPQFDMLPARAAAAAALAASVNPLSSLAAYHLTAGATADVPVRVSGPEGTRLEADFAPRLPGLYALRFTDETGLTGVRLLDLRTFPDPPPVVALARPDPARDPLTLLPTATIPLQARAEDRTFAVRSAVLEYRVGPDGPFRELPLVDLAAAVHAAPAAVGFPGALRAKPLGLDVSRQLPVAALVKPDGTAPADGDVVTLRVAATDWDDVAWAKEPGRSRDVEVRVTGKSSLETLFQKELAALRPELLRLREDQRGAREAVTEVARADKPSAEDAAKLGRAEQAQRAVRNQVADPDAGVRAKVDKLRQTLRANGLPRSPTGDRVEAVADDLARLADDLLESADPAVSAAAREDDPAKRTALAAAAAGKQEAAEAGFDAALSRLEQWAGAGEVRGQARALQDQLNRAAADAAKATDKVPAGKAPEQLSPAERNALEPPAGKLDQLAKQADDLVGKTARLADEKAKQAAAMAATVADKAKQADALAADAARQPPGSAAAADLRLAAADLKAEADALKQAADRAKAEADALKNAASEAGGLGLPDDLRAAADALRRNQPGQSDARRTAAADRIERLTDALSEKPTEPGDELRKKRKDAGDDIDRLAAAQDELRKKSKAAAANPDPAQRAEELQKLAREQQQLRREADRLAERLTRDRDPKAAEQVRKAAEEMKAAADALERGQPPAEKQEDSLDRLDEALNRLEAEEKKEQEQLSREKREDLAAKLRAVRDRQKAAVDEAGRIQDAVEKGKGWSRAQLRSYLDLDAAQQGLSDELRAAVEKELEGLPVFARLATQAADAMKKAASQVAARAADADPGSPFEPDIEQAADARVRRPMRTALRRLDQILDSLKDEPKPMAAGEPASAPGGEAPGEDGAGQPGGVPPLAQLKALRAVQAEVNERTAAFAKAHPNADALTDDDRDELKEIEQTQREVADLFEKLAPALLPGGGI